MRLFTVYALVSFAVAKSTSSPNSVKSAISTASAQASAPSASASAASLSPCALACITDAAAASPCNVPTNLTCVCTDPNFRDMSNSCLTDECLPSEVGVALGLQAAECGPLSLSATAAPTATGPFTPANPFADISSGSSSTASGLASGPGSSSPSAAPSSASGSGSSSPSTASGPPSGSGSSPFPTASDSAPGSGSSSPSTTGATVALLSPQSTMGLMLAMGIAVVGGLVGGVII
ncbi:hypothetical protein MSAN_01974200 [Mycena sanguinolenta]|uniref:CFEM domain-containing protein n=1 Tax=Mycena sanguinolenta TaxID=230812 RepID=A0A8H6XNA6_9AGAR|nr:hypothetical protein MSAN_01974200 [Mycena sanguinolenta]